MTYRHSSQGPVQLWPGPLAPRAERRRWLGARRINGLAKEYQLQLPFFWLFDCLGDSASMPLGSCRDGTSE